MGTQNRIDVVIADDHRIVREGLSALFRTCPEFEIVGEAGDGKTAIQLVAKLRPRVLLLDYSMPGMDGAEIARHLSKQFPAVAVVMISCHTDAWHIQQALDAGALAYVTKMTVTKDLCEAMLAAARGERFLGPIARQSFDGGRRELAQFSQSLTRRQSQVLRFIAEGYANKQIAAELSISIKTVEKHRQEVMDKLGIHNTAGLTRFAIEAGVIGVPESAAIS